MAGQNELGELNGEFPSNNDKNDRTGDLLMIDSNERPTRRLEKMWTS